VDTLVRRAAVETARQRLAIRARALDGARARNRELDRRAKQARELANVTAPPLAMLAAALVLAAVVGFAVSLQAELRHPRLADAAEAARVTGVRVLAVLGPRRPNPERMRRRADRELLPLIDVATDSYRMLYLHFAARGAVLPLITLTGDEASVVATVATNLAAASAVEARGTLLVDGDLAEGVVAGVLRLSPEPGLAGIIRELAEWGEAIVTVTVGRDRMLDVVPSGVWVGAMPSAEVAERVRHDLTRLACRYDLAVLVAPTAELARGAASMLPSPDVILCARMGHTPLEWLALTVDALCRGGARVRGLVLWAADPPEVPTRDEVLAMRPRTARPEARVGV
jgi:Mrp family chromosome partitioning ATPase